MYRLCSHAWSDIQDHSQIMGVVRNVNHESLIGMSCVILGFGLGVAAQSLHFPTLMIVGHVVCTLYNTSLCYKNKLSDFTLINELTGWDV